MCRPSESEVRTYFQLDFPLSNALDTFPDDVWLRHACAYAPGLRILRQDPWETLASFICSAVKQIVQIQAINQDLRKSLGDTLASGFSTFPAQATLARAGEVALRSCKLGFRARHLYRTSILLSESAIDLHAWSALSTSELKQNLLKLPGVGEKIADCVMLFGYGRMEAFPIDVWVQRVLQGLYFAKARNKSPERMRKFALKYFGPYRGYAQQYLFHWIRTSGEFHG